MRDGETGSPDAAPPPPTQQIEALNRTQSILPVRPGLPENATHDYQRNGTTTLFARLEVATGTVTDQCYQCHGKAEFLDFLKEGRPRLPLRHLHVVCDNYHTQKHADISGWLAKNPRIALHSPQPQEILAQPGGSVLQHHHPAGHPPRSFDSVKELTTAIQTFITGWNDRCHPVVSTTGH